MKVAGCGGEGPRHPNKRDKGCLGWSHVEWTQWRVSRTGRWKRGEGCLSGCGFEVAELLREEGKGRVEGGDRCGKRTLWWRMVEVALMELGLFCYRRENCTEEKFQFSKLLDEDAEKLRLHTLSEAGDLDSLEKKINDSDSEDSSNGSSSNSP
ncbi:hypothetical protein U1Q18_047551 [Sarracenia purpurea var. burkii]